MIAKVAELVDAQDSGSCARFGCKGSSPFFRTDEIPGGVSSSGFFHRIFQQWIILWDG